MDIGPTELIIILVIVVLLFGSGRIANLGGELGKGIAEFRRAMSRGADRDETPAPAASNDKPA